MTEAERLLKTALDELAGAVVVWGPDGRVAHASRGFLELFGLEADEVEGRDEDGLEDALERHGATASPGAPVLESSSGARLERRARPLLDGARLETFHDLSAEAERAERHEEILGVASHDLRSPLANVRSYAGLLLSGRLQVEPRVRRSAEVIARNADKALRLLQSWFDTQRAETGEFDLDRQPQPLATLLDEAIGPRRAVASEKGVEIVSHLPPTLPVVEVERERFLNALGALLENALARSEPAGVVDVFYEERPYEVWLGFADTGPALTREEARLAFDRDEQVLRERHLGTGFALSVARAVMQGHGGTAGVWAEPDRTTFFLVLPRRAVPLQAPAQPPA